MWEHSLKSVLTCDPHKTYLFNYNDSLGLFVAYGTAVWSNRFHGELIDLLDHWEHVTSHVSFPMYITFLSHLGHYYVAFVK